MHARRRISSALVVGLLVATGLVGAAPAHAEAPVKQPVAQGFGGAVASDTVESTEAGLEVLRQGGTAADAAVAVAAVLGVTDPFVAGLGGGGYFVFYDARRHQVFTIDGRETTPAAGDATMFVNPATGQPYDFPTAVTSGLSVGVPGMLATWQRALDQWGRLTLAQNLRPAIQVADNGFVVDAELRDQIGWNQQRFAQFTSSRELFLPGGAPPAVGSVLRNPDLADAYREIARHGTGAFYGGAIGRDMVAAVRNPPLAPNATITPIPGRMTMDDVRRYRTIDREPTHSRYRDVDVYGMAPSSAGGITVGESLNILERFNLSRMDRGEALHHYLEATRLAFADRNRYIGDPAFVDVPQGELLSDRFAGQRACLIDPSRAQTSPVPPGDPFGTSQCVPAGAGASTGTEGMHTNHFVVSDRWGNVVSYTNTIENLGGSGIVVPGRGFLLNNELTDFNFAPTQGTAPDPNLPAAGKRPRSSMSPTIVLKHGRPFLAVGSPGGPTIITTVVQILVNRLDFGMTLPESIAAPRASQLNLATTVAEPAFQTEPIVSALRARGHTFSTSPILGVVAGLEFLPHGEVIAAGEPTRRGGTSAGVVLPRG